MLFTDNKLLSIYTIDLLFPFSSAQGLLPSVVQYLEKSWCYISILCVIVVASGGRINQVAHQ
jgi:hypothetical protein